MLEQQLNGTNKRLQDNSCSLVNDNADVCLCITQTGACARCVAQTVGLPSVAHRMSSAVGVLIGRPYSASLPVNTPFKASVAPSPTTDVPPKM